jgi:hypothetical protein
LQVGRSKANRAENSTHIEYGFVRIFQNDQCEDKCSQILSKEISIPDNLLYTIGYRKLFNEILKNSKMYGAFTLSIQPL